MTGPELAQFIQSMPKTELHIHLEGAIQPATLLELARRHHVINKLPAQDLPGLREWFHFTDFPHFVEVYLTISNLLMTPDDFALIVLACAEDMAAQNIRYREYTVTPFTHTHIQSKLLTIDDILDGLELGREAARRRHNVEMRWIFDIPRHASFFGRNQGSYDPTPADYTLDYALRGIERGVIGLGLGGNEVIAPPEPFAHAFEAAKQAGLKCVPHAGESTGATSVWGAVHALHADRIGHGVRAIEDPALLTLLRDRQITLEICPTSNICLHVYRRLAEHPFPHLDHMGLQVTVNSDDPPLFNTSLCQEFTVLADEYGYGPHDLAHIARNAIVASAAPDELRRSLLTEFDAWFNTSLPSLASQEREV
jgi:aminodeoxyfutalosine deaminase